MFDRFLKHLGVFIKLWFTTKDLMEVLILGTNADLSSKGFTMSMKIILSAAALRTCS